MSEQVTKADLDRAEQRILMLVLEAIQNGNDGLHAVESRVERIDAVLRADARRESQSSTPPAPDALAAEREQNLHAYIHKCEAAYDCVLAKNRALTAERDTARKENERLLEKLTHAKLRRRAAEDERDGHMLDANEQRKRAEEAEAKLNALVAQLRALPSKIVRFPDTDYVIHRMGDILDRHALEVKEGQ